MHKKVTTKDHLRVQNALKTHCSTCTCPQIITIVFICHQMNVCMANVLFTFLCRQCVLEMCKWVVNMINTIMDAGSSLLLGCSPRGEKWG